MTFLPDVLGFAKSPYKRQLGRHTLRFTRRAVKKAVNESQKRLWVKAGVAAEEFVAALLELDNRRNAAPFHKRILRENIAKKQVLSGLRTYLSAIIVLISTHKDDILQRTAMTEQTFLQVWCWVFEYQQEDMKVFDEILLPAYRQFGYGGLIRETGKIFAENYYHNTGELTQEEITLLERILFDDVAGILQYVK